MDDRYAEVKYELKENYGVSLSDCELKRSGSVVVYGHEDTIKIIK